MVEPGKGARLAKRGRFAIGFSRFDDQGVVFVEKLGVTGEAAHEKVLGFIVTGIWGD